MKNTNSNKGITLVALVITIIILLILAAVAIRSITGDGIIFKAKEARTSYETADEKERIMLGYTEYKIANSVVEDSQALTVEGASSVVGDGISGWTITFDKTGNVYNLTPTGEIEEGTVIEGMTDEEKATWDAQTSEAYFIWDGTTITGYASTTLPETLIIPTKCTAITTSFASEGTQASNLTAIKTVKIPSTVKSLTRAFTNFTGLTTIEFNKPTITEIGEYAFRGCSSLVNITIPNTVTKISNEAFLLCTSLQGIVVPNSVTELGKSVFWGCSNLETISMSNNIEKINNGSGFAWNTKWFSSQSDGPVYLENIFICYKGTIPENYELTIKPGTKVIGDLINAKKITIPNSVVYIYNSSWNTLTSLESVVIESGSPLSTSSENYPWGISNTDIIQWQ